MMYNSMQKEMVATDINKQLSDIEFLNREYDVSHLDYNTENEFFNAIREGRTIDVNTLKPLDSKGMGQLSDDAVTNLKYHLIISVALITRYCIEGGMEMETAFNLSDIYIRSIDKCRTKAEINMLHREIFNDYVSRMNIIRKKNRCPKAITVCLDYIYNNLHTKITLDVLSEVSSLSPSYLSKLFKKEVGSTVSEYITEKKIEEARNMLHYSDLSILEISEYLCFSSESHFIQIFRRLTGYTPKVYRDKFFRVKNK